MIEGVYKHLAGRRPMLLDKSARLISAVLLPLVEDEGGLKILFEVRPRHLNRQPGEICFPGGRIEKFTDSNPLATAIRETSEELVIAEEDIEVIGPLDIMASPLGTLIHPYVGRLKATEIRPDPNEVEECFTVPVDFLLADPPYATEVEVATRYRTDFPLDKVPPTYKEGWQVRTTYPMFFYEYNQYFIWGLTGILLFNFLSTCWPDHPTFKKPFKKWPAAPG